MTNKEAANHLEHFSKDKLGFTLNTFRENTFCNPQTFDRLTKALDLAIVALREKGDN